MPRYLSSAFENHPWQLIKKETNLIKVFTCLVRLKKRILGQNIKNYEIYSKIVTLDHAYIVYSSISAVLT